MFKPVPGGQTATWYDLAWGLLPGAYLLSEGGIVGWACGMPLMVINGHLMWSDHRSRKRKYLLSAAFLIAAYAAFFIITIVFRKIGVPKV
jgi:hypothetical protein